MEGLSQQIGAYEPRLASLHWCHYIKEKTKKPTREKRELNARRSSGCVLSSDFFVIISNMLNSIVDWTGKQRIGAFQ